MTLDSSRSAQIEAKLAAQGLSRQSATTKQKQNKLLWRVGSTKY